MQTKTSVEVFVAVTQLYKTLRENCQGYISGPRWISRFSNNFRLNYLFRSANDRVLYKC